MHSKENWDDLRYVLAVARKGSVTAAARQLGVNHATVLRRVAAFEARHGIELFDKTVRGYRLAPGSEPVLEALAEAETAIMSVERAASGAGPALRGLVRVTSTDTFCTTILPQVVRKVRQEAPDLTLELVSSNLHLDLGRLDADVTVRPSPALPEDLRGQEAAALGFATYEAVGGTADAWLGLSGPLSRAPAARWLQAAGHEARIVARSDSFLTLRDLAATGLGRAILPAILGEADPRLRRCRAQPEGLSVPIWVASHRDLRDVPRVRAVRRRITQAIAEAAVLLATGRPDGG